MKLQHQSDPSARRAAEYPKIEDQLDMLWHSMNKGELNKAEPFYSSLKAVKDKYRKAGK